MSERSHKAFESKGRRTRAAVELLGCSLDGIPKSALAVVAFYLALGYDEGAGPVAARERVFREWETLHAQGIIESPPPATDKGKD